jgi:aspartate 1-decarboxylase
MRRTLFRSKIHRATVTHADRDYEGSLSVDALLLDAADILPYERVCVWNVSNGSRLETYALPAERGSGVVCANGGAAHHVAPGDLVIIATFGEAETEEEARAWRPRVTRVDARNRLLAGPERERPGPQPPFAAPA